MKLIHDEITFLVQITNEDAIIKKRILEMLQLSSFERRLQLNIWLEQLRHRNASDKMQYILSILFDDVVAKKVLTLINNCSN